MNGGKLTLRTLRRPEPLLRRPFTELAQSDQLV